MTYKYSAFISYCHQDERWARWLQKALETYRVPRRLTGAVPDRVIPRNLGPVFRDRSELSASADLGGEIEQALRQSANLIVICSPAAAASRWVNEEVRLFARVAGARRIFCLIAGGEPNAATQSDECFPPSLREIGAEPVAADARKLRDGKTGAKLKLVAGLLNVGLDELKQREQTRRYQRLAAAASLALFVAAGATGLAVEALIQRDAAQQRQREAEDSVGFMLNDLTTKLRQVQRLDIMDAVDDKLVAYFRGRQTRDLTDQALMIGAQALQNTGDLREKQNRLPEAMSLFQESARLGDELVRRTPNDAQRLIIAGLGFNHLGNAYWFEGNRSDAGQSFDRAIGLLQRAAQLSPSSDRALEALTSARTNKGRVLEAEGELAAAREQYEAVRAISGQRVQRRPDDPDEPTTLAQAYDSLGKVALEQGLLSEAISNYRKRQAIAARLSAANASNNELRENLVLSDGILGRTLALCGANSAAERYAREAVTLAKSLVDYDQTQSGWQVEYGKYSLLLGRLSAEAGNVEEGAQLNAEALRTLGDLVRNGASNTAWRQELANAEIESARFEFARGHRDKSALLLQATLQRLAEDRKSNPADRNLILLEAQARITLGQVAASRNDMAAAHAQWQTARDVIAVPARLGADPNFLSALASALLLLGDRTAARPVLDQLATMGFRTPLFQALLDEKKQSYQGRSTNCGGEEK